MGTCQPASPRRRRFILSAGAAAAVAVISLAGQKQRWPR